MNEKKILKFVFLLLLMLSSGSCVFDKLEDVSTGVEPVKVVFSTRAFTQDGVTFSAFRLIAFNTAGSVEINKTLDDLVPSGNNLTMDLRPGVYTLFAVGNELSDMSPALDAASSESDVDAVRINRIENRDSTSLPVAWKRTIYVRQKTPGSNIGQLSLNNKDWFDHMDIETERLASKLEFYVRKENPLDVVSVKIVTPKNMPKYSFVTPMAYNGEYYSTPLSMNHAVTDDLTLLIDRIYPEHILSASQNKTFVELDMNVNGEDIKASVPVGQLDRNKIYRYEILVKRRTVEIENIQVLPWNDVETDQSVDGVEFNLSDVEVPYSYGQESRVYFTTKNIAPDNMNLSTGVYSETGAQIGSLSKYFDQGTKLTYDNYDPTTRLGSGYITIRRKVPSSQRLGLLIFAARLKKIIFVKSVNIAGSNIYWDESARKLAFDNTPTDGMSAPHESYQGVFFPYGGLECYPGGLEMPEKVTPPLWSAIGDYRAPDNANPTLNAAGKSIIPFEPDKGIGDICVYMSRRGLTPDKKKWRLPYLSEFQDFKVRQREVKPYPTSLSEDGTGLIYNGMRVDNNIFFPYSGLGWFLNRNTGKYKPFAVNRTFLPVQDDVFSLNAGDALSFDMGGNKVFNVFYAFTTRCVADDTPDALVPLYVLSYDLTNAGVVNIPTPDGFLKSEHVDAGGTFTLSSVELLLNKGQHKGWIVDGQMFPLGATIPNVNKDIVATPYIENI